MGYHQQHIKNFMISMKSTIIIHEFLRDVSIALDVAENVMLSSQNGKFHEPFFFME